MLVGDLEFQVIVSTVSSENFKNMKKKKLNFELCSHLGQMAQPTLIFTMFRAAGYIGSTTTIFTNPGLGFFPSTKTGIASVG
jgi:hypothetical protein